MARGEDPHDYHWMLPFEKRFAARVGRTAVQRGKDRHLVASGYYFTGALWGGPAATGGLLAAAGNSIGLQTVESVGGAMFGICFAVLLLRFCQALLHLRSH